MFGRAEQDPGGRGERQDDAILCWSSRVGADAPRSGPQGEAYFRWQTPTFGEATLCHIAWAPTEGGAESVVWQALEALAGRSLRRV